ncbi:MAG TPA: PQQ-dependent sugar dehydrogenase [Pyrinomonadaceae bacterium]|nr:PQQ-dependent sugar dehydrogenase [Pyrinomonadaceae bacterium]
MRKALHVCFLAAALAASAPAAGAASLPEGFVERAVASGLAGATAMAFAPDGRLFVCQQDGRLRVVKNGSLLAEPFVTIAVDPTGERGLLGIAFDPDFASNGFVYLYHTTATAPRHNRIVRFTADGDRALPGSETLIFRLDDLGPALVHNGGAMHFGPDGKLYVAVGENGVAANAQTLSNLHGKMLRLNRDGTIPEDNPFFNQTTGNRRAVWATGLRNPFTFAFQPGATRLYVNDVGEQTWEEINEGAAGANFGWPESEGPTSNPAHHSPVYAYRHGAGGASACAITGGAFYNPPAAQFPQSYVGRYFFADFCGGWIRTFDPLTGAVADFATGAGSPVDLKVGPDGSLYYLSRGGRAVFQVVYAGAGAAPVITSDPVSQIVPAGAAVSFTVSALGAQPLTYQWQRDGANVAGANSPTLTLAAATAADDGARFRCVVSNASGSATSAEAVLSVTANRPPVAAVGAPAEGALYSAGATVSYSGSGTDPEDGALPPAALTWQVDFHHDDHAHPFLPPTTGAASGSFVVPAVGETSPNVWYRVRLIARDSGGLTHETFRDVRPRLSVVTLRTEPAGLQLALDGRAVPSGHAFTGVVGIVRALSAPERQTLDGVEYEFRDWSDGGAAAHEITTAAADTTLTATYAPAPPTGPRTIAFESAEYRVVERFRQVTLRVMRGGDATRAASVEYATADGTATDRSDYTTAIGRLDFAPGETEQTITIIIIHGAAGESTESFTVALSNPSGGATLGVPSVAKVSIEDEDYPPISNPIDEARYFVRQHYHDFLSREPDEPGLDFWAGVIAECEDRPEDEQQGCREVRRVNVSAAFFLSLEFQETGFFVYQMTRAALGRLPRFRDFVRDTQALGRGVVVGQGDWSARLEANRRAFLAEFVARPEFVAALPDSLTPAEYVARLAANVGAPLTPEKRQDLTAQLVSGAATRSDVLVAVAQDLDFRAAEFNRAFVLMQYFGYLRRNPDDSPDSDFSGHQFWLDQLNRHGGNYVTAELVKAFILSLEYRRRFVN